MLFESVHILRYDFFSMSLLSFVHNEQFFVPNVFCTEMGFPFHSNANSIFSCICDGGGFESGSKKLVKWFANESDFLPICTSPYVTVMS